MNKTLGDIIILHKCTKTHDHKLYCSWDMAWGGCNCYFSFWAIFASLPPYQPKKLKQKKLKKNPVEISSFYTCVPKIMIRWCTVPETWWVMDGQTDGQSDRHENWHIEVGTPPTKNLSEQSEIMKMQKSK